MVDQDPPQPAECPPTSDQESILVIDDRTDLTRFCRRVMGGSYVFLHVPNAKEAECHLIAGTVSAVLLDRDFSKADHEHLLAPPEETRNEGLYILRWLRQKYPQIPVLMVTGFREQRAALEAAELGCDFLAWQDIIGDPDILRARLSRALALAARKDETLLRQYREHGIVAESREFTQTLVELHRALPGNAPILLLGETGTGKDTLAFAVHALSGDSTRSFVSVNVAALNPSLIENELFGHARGAFTGADRAAMGKLRYAHGGTLFLNEVGDLSPEAQTKLLTAIEHKEVVPVGDVQHYPADFRLVAATSRDFQAMVEKGSMRRDLYYRLAWHTIHIPPLRARRQDIQPLIRAFLHRAGQGADQAVVGITKEAVDYLTELPWPGNVRELQAVIESAGALASHIITLTDVREVVRRQERPGDQGSPAETAAPGGQLPQQASDDRRRHEAKVFDGLSYRELTERYFTYLYDKSEGRLSEVARCAGLAKATVYDWKERYGRHLSIPEKSHRSGSGGSR